MLVHRKVERKKVGLQETPRTTTRHIRRKETPKVGREGLNENVQKKSPQGSRTDREIGEILHRMDETLEQESKTLTASH